MSSNRSSYASSYAQDKGYTRPSTSSSYASSSATSSIYANSAQSSRNYRYGSKPQVTVHNGGGQTNDPNTSSTGNGSYYN